MSTEIKDKSEDIVVGSPDDKIFIQEEELAAKAEKSEIAKVKKKAKKTEKTIKVLKPLSGKFLLSDTAGEIVNKDVKLADVIIEAGYAKEV